MNSLGLRVRLGLTLWSALLLAFGVLAGRSAWADNIDLATLPDRDQVELTIYNAEDLTLVRERRRLSFKRGENVLQFSWANTLIDPTSVQLKIARKNRSQGQRLRLLDARFPHQRSTTLYWRVDSDFDGEAEVEIAYFTSGLSWQADYVAIATASEDALRLEGFVRVINRSGERFEDAKVRLVVGEINLLDRIEELARSEEFRRIKKKAEKERILKQRRRQMVKRTMAEMAFADELAAAAPKPIEKQGASEYFIYTIGGRETLDDGSSKRLRSFVTPKAGIRSVYRYWPQRYGAHLEHLYVLANNKDAGLGTTPLPNGELRSFRRNDAGDLRFVAQQSLQYVPLGAEIELRLGADPAVFLDDRRLRLWRDRIVARYGRADVLQRIDEGGGSRALRVDHRAKVVGWDRHEQYRLRVVNRSGRDANISWRRAVDGDASWASKEKDSNAVRRHDNRSLEWDFSVPAGDEQVRGYRLSFREGRNAKQQGLRIN